MSHAEREHSIFGASSAHRWMRCPGSIRAEEGLPDLGNASARERGTAAHELLDYCLKTQQPTALKFLGMEMNGIPINIEMANAVQECLEWLADLLEQYPDAVFYNEVGIKVPLRSAPEEGFGTADIIIYVPSLKRLYVVDFKHGFGVVLAADNEQGMHYSVGAVRSGIAPDAVEIFVVIIQPNAIKPGGPVDVFQITRADIIDFEEELNQAVDRCLDPNAPLLPGDIQCKWCKARHTCAAAEQFRLTNAGMHFRDVKLVDPNTLPDIRRLDVQKLAALNVHGDALISWIRKAQEYAFELAMANYLIPGNKLVQGQRRRKFNTERWTEKELMAAILELSEYKLDLDQIAPRRLAAIGDMETLLKLTVSGSGRKVKAQRKRDLVEALAMYTVRDHTATVNLVPESDPRPAYNPVQVAFEGVALPLPTEHPNNEPNA